MAVIAYVGFHGSGKTYAMTEAVMKAADKGWHIGHNYDFRHPTAGVEYLGTWGDIMRYARDACRRWKNTGQRSLLAIDELGALCPARGWGKFPPALTLICMEARKLGLEIHWTSQSVEFVDKYWREVTSEVVKCAGFGSKRLSKVEGPGIVTHRPRFFITRRYDGHDFGRASAKSRGFRIARFNPRVGECFDTMFIVELAAHLMDEQIGELESVGPLSGPQERLELVLPAPATPTPRRAAKRPDGARALPVGLLIASMRV